MNNSTAKYIAQIKRIPRLTKKEEERLFRKIKEKGDEDAIKKITKNYLMLLVKIALNYSRFYPNIILEAPDLFHEGYKGVLKATEKFDYENKEKCSFYTYATWWVRQAIVFALYNDSRTIRVSISAAQQSNLYHRIKNEAAQEIFPEKIAEKMGISVKNREKLEKTPRLICEARVISMDAPIKGTEDRWDTGVVGDLVSDKKIPNPEEVFQNQQMKEKVRKMLLTCSPREEKVLRMRFGIGEKKNHTLGETGDMFSMTRERIRQIEKKALRKLRKKFAIKGNSKSFNFKNYL